MSRGERSRARERAEPAPALRVRRLPDAPTMSYIGLQSRYPHLVRPARPRAVGPHFLLLAAAAIALAASPAVMTPTRADGREACAQARHLPSSFFSDPDVMAAVLRAIVKHEFPAGRYEREVYEELYQGCLDVWWSFPYPRPSFYDAPVVPNAPVLGFRDFPR